uniref:Protein root UVB sensitive 6 isoform X3 n=1 Tax=Nicotiana tabacum TaxID=4097 RepID=A0A1S3XW88_TOBAC|nr:PREDICTED: protein root UVB sensitive 6-like isoform X3 [Nicotiana tabacum]
MKLKHPPSSSSQTLTSTASSHDATLLVRETLRISADLASAPPSPSVSAERRPEMASFGLNDRQFVDSSLRLLCCEEIDGRRWKYFADESVNCGSQPLKKNAIRAVSLQSPQAPVEEFMGFIRSYVVPEGFPGSVTPSYVPYMTWRALKDGAGRVGKMLYARQGKKFDYDLKQLRFAGDLLMELGAGVELVTAVVPQFFLPLACAANVAKNVGAVTSTSTRTPIYKAFAKGENIGDVTAKGECVGNLADLLGTGLSIMIAKRNPSLVKTFALLSFGYVFSSYQEVKSVVLHTLNRARFTVAVESFLRTGRVPTLQDGNSRENIFSFPWKKHRPIVLGPRFREAFQDPNSYLAVKPIFEKEQYIVSYNPFKGNIYVLLKDQAKSDDVLKAAFHGHVLLHIIRSSTDKQSSSRKQREDELSASLLSTADLQAHVIESYKMVSALYMPFKSKAKEQVKRNLPLNVIESYKMVSALYMPFKSKAKEQVSEHFTFLQGWVMSESLLNPGRARLCEMVK